MLRYLIGAVAGGLGGYFILYKLIGCYDGSCPMTANPYLSTIIGTILGMLIAGVIVPSANIEDAEPPKITGETTLTEYAGGIAPAITTVTTASPEKTDEIDIIDEPVVVEYKKLTAEEAKKRIDSGDEVIILDVRTESEYNYEHIPNAILIPNETIIDEMPELLPDLNAEILIYCHSGNRSSYSARKLIEIGYTNVYDFGGIIEWPYETVKN